SGCRFALRKCVKTKNLSLFGEREFTEQALASPRSGAQPLARAKAANEPHDRPQRLPATTLAHMVVAS
ncbi:hypothetical protein, partial [Rhodoblastus sp.]|uniref:hypothetical protein n=1 Tax=Rhodoblastus sp. TaxID=1962975 RepID=UPI003F9DE966